MPEPALKAPASASRPLATGTATVIVACKQPNGHRARLHTEQEINAVINGVVIKTKQFFATGEEFLFKGPAHGQDEGPRVVTASGYALTFGVPADFWDKWHEQHKQLDMVRDGLIFAFERKNDVIAAAKERKGTVTGLERLNPKKLPPQNGVKVEVSPDSPVKIGRLDDEFEEQASL